MEELTTILVLIFGFIGTIGTICSILYLLIKPLSKEIKDVRTEIKDVKTEINKLDIKLSTEIKEVRTEIKEVRTELKELDNKWSQTKDTFYKEGKENDKKFNDIIRSVERMERQHQEHLTYFHKISNKK